MRMPTWRYGRWNNRFLIAVSILLLGSFGLLHFKAVRSGLESFIVVKNLADISRLVVKQRRTCPSDFIDVDSNLVFLTVKTTHQYHAKRLQLLLTTWISDALLIKGKNREPVVKVAVVSDAVDDFANRLLGGRMVQSRCSNSHNKTDLCCKQSAEFDLYFAEKNQSRWYCHFDDDNYVNIYNLLNELETYNDKLPLYLGKSSRGKAKLKDVISATPNQHVVFMFGTGGAGFCLTRPAMHRIKAKISRILGGQGLEGLCRRLPGLADDVAVGYVAAYYNISLTPVSGMHSHLEKLSLLSEADVQEAISLSYTRYRSYENTVRLPPFYSTQPSDPTRFLSLHHYLRRKECSATSAAPLVT